MSKDTATPTALGPSPTSTPAASELERWPVLPCPQPPLGRDVALDLLRGLAMLILVVNHMGLRSWASIATSSVLSAAEVLVPVSGVAVGMVFGNRWRRQGGHAVTRMLWARARKIYVASVVVVSLVGLASLAAPGVTEVITTSRSGSGLYAFDGPLDVVLGVLALQAGPWQFCILSFFVVTLYASPALLWLLDRGAWAPVLAASLATYLLGRHLEVDVLPTQSEGPFPLLIWQALFVPGLVLGFHRREVAARLAEHRRRFFAAVSAAAIAAVAMQVGLAPAGVLRWQAAHFDKASLDPLRVAVMLVLALTAYLLMRRRLARVERTVGPVLLPLGRNSFYVFIVHVPLCALVAALPFLDRDGLGMVGNSVAALAGVGAIVLLIRHQVLFRWIPR